MKILRISSLGYVGGGVETGIQLLQPVLTEMGHEVRILTSSHNPQVTHFSDYEFAPISSHPLLLRFLYRVWYPDAYVALRHALKDFRPDIVQIHSTFEVSASVLFALRGYPTVLTIHGAEDYTKKLLLWAFPLRFFRTPNDYTPGNLTFGGFLRYLYHLCISLPVYRLGFRNVNTFVVFSEYMRRMMAHEGLECVSVPNATLLFDPAPINVHKRHLLYVGRLEKIKGVHVAIEALAQVRETYPDAQLTIAGRGAYEAELKKLVAEKGLEDAVTFAGHCTRRQLYDLYKQCTVLVVPSIWPEPFGKIGVEAYSVGRPVIATDVGGIRDWLTDGDTGYLIQEGNADMLAQKIVSFFDEPDLIGRMAERALIRAQEFTIQRHAEQMLTVYQTTIDEFTAEEQTRS